MSYNIGSSLPEKSLTCYFVKPVYATILLSGSIGMVCLRYNSGGNAILTADNTLDRSFRLYKNSCEIQTAPDLIILSLTVVSGKIPSFAKGTVILMSGVKARFDQKVGNTLCIVVKAVGFNNSVLDIEQFPE